MLESSFLHHPLYHSLRGKISIFLVSYAGCENIKSMLDAEPRTLSVLLQYLPLLLGPTGSFQIPAQGLELGKQA